MSKLQQIEQAIEGLSRTELTELLEWIEDYLEDELEFTDEFKEAIAQGKRELAEGKGRVRKS
jgi:hypothetical protein